MGTIQPKTTLKARQKSAKIKMKTVLILLSLFALANSGAIRRKREEEMPNNDNDDVDFDVINNTNEAFRKFRGEQQFFQKTNAESDCGGYQVTINGPQGLGVIKGCGEDLVEAFEVFGMQLSALQTPLVVGLQLALKGEEDMSKS